MTYLSPAEVLLKKYGIAKPRDIDLEVLAYTVGAKVKFKQMESCEARITGLDNSAVITVDNRYGEKRARFSLSHELGHWHHHRNQQLYCAKKDIGSAASAKAKEREADRYAADILMPRYMFEPRMRTYSRPSFKSIKELGEEFDVSRKATALRYVNLDGGYSMLICWGLEGRKWYRPSKHWLDNWAPKKDHDPDTDVLDLLFGKISEARGPVLCPASAFFGRYDAEQHGVYAHSVISGSQSDPNCREVLTFLTPQSADMFEATRRYGVGW